MKGVPKTCVVCASEFTPHNGKSKTCSADCQHEHRRALSREYVQRNYQPRPRRSAVSCQSCGTQVEPPRTGPLPKWCPACRARKDDERIRRRQIGPDRKCHKCGVDVPESAGKPGLTVCQGCRSDPRDPASARPKERARTLRKYGITQAQYDELLIDQKERCPICGTGDPGAKGWCIDHCHDTDKVRGLLCNQCNTALGLMKEDQSALLAMVAYIEKHGEEIKV